MITTLLLNLKTCIYVCYNSLIDAANDIETIVISLHTFLIQKNSIAILKANQIIGDAKVCVDYLSICNLLVKESENKNEENKINFIAKCLWKVK